MNSSALANDEDKFPNTLGVPFSIDTSAVVKVVRKLVFEAATAMRCARHLKKLSFSLQTSAISHVLLVPSSFS